MTDILPPVNSSRRGSNVPLVKNTEYITSTTSKFDKHFKEQELKIETLISVCSSALNKIGIVEKDGSKSRRESIEDIKKALDGMTTLTFLPDVPVSPINNKRTLPSIVVKEISTTGIDKLCFCISLTHTHTHPL